VLNLALKRSSASRTDRGARAVQASLLPFFVSQNSCSQNAVLSCLDPRWCVPFPRWSWNRFDNRRWALTERRPARAVEQAVHIIAREEAPG